MYDFKIDLVYMWVDGSDPHWLEKKSKYDANLDLTRKESFSECRYFDNQELRFSLRSVEKYAPWINHIYIITDDQIPSWLDEVSDRLTIVDHKEILPNENLPCFNSTALEWGIANIPNLSEHFIYMNDDMFFCDYVRPSDFFLPDGKPITRLRKRSLLYYRYKKHSNYAQIVYSSIKRIKVDFGALYAMTPHHCADAYLKTSYLECREYYKELVEVTLKNRFRNDSDIHRSIIALYSLVTGKSVLKWVHNTYDSMHLSNTLKDYKKVIEKFNPMMICLNDNHKSIDKDRERAYAFFNDFFRKKSNYEK